MLFLVSPFLEVSNVCIFTGETGTSLEGRIAQDVKINNTIQKFTRNKGSGKETI